MQKDILNLFDNIAIARGLEFFDSVIYLNSFNIILSVRYFSNKVAELLFFTLNLPQHRNRDINNLYTIYTDVALFFYHSTGSLQRL